MKHTQATTTSAKPQSRLLRRKPRTRLFLVAALLITVGIGIGFKLGSSHHRTTKMPPVVRNSLAPTTASRKINNCLAATAQRAKTTVGAAGQTKSSPPVRHPQNAAFKAMSRSEQASFRHALYEARYAVTLQHQGVRLFANNPAQQLTARFRDDGVRIESGANGQWQATFGCADSSLATTRHTACSRC